MQIWIGAILAVRPCSAAAPDLNSGDAMNRNRAPAAIVLGVALLAGLERQFRGRGVQFLALDVGDDSIAEIAALALEHGIEFPFGKDRGAACARALGARRTPEVAVLDGERRLRYRGRIDDQYRLGGAVPAPTKTDLRDALEAILAGKEITSATTPIDGCPITVTAPSAPAGPITFAEHIAPIL